MADSPQVQPLPGLVEGGLADLGAAAAAADPVAAAHPTAAVQDVPIHSHRLGRVLHILHISVTAGLTTPCFMGPLGIGSRHEWKEDHLVALLGSVWTRVSYSYHTRIIPGVNEPCYKSYLHCLLLLRQLRPPKRGACSLSVCFRPCSSSSNARVNTLLSCKIALRNNTKSLTRYLVSRNQTKHAQLILELVSYSYHTRYQ